jgi:hypothetical protein
MKVLVGDTPMTRRNLRDYIATIVTPGVPANDMLLKYLDSYGMPYKGLRLITGQDWPPVGGLDLLTPPIRIAVVKNGNAINVHHSTHTLSIPENISAREFNRQLSRALR